MMLCLCICVRRCGVSVRVSYESSESILRIPACGRITWRIFFGTHWRLFRNVYLVNPLFRRWFIVIVKDFILIAGRPLKVSPPSRAVFWSEQVHFEFGTYLRSQKTPRHWNTQNQSAGTIVRAALYSQSLDRWICTCKGISLSWNSESLIVEGKFKHALTGIYQFILIGNVYMRSHQLVSSGPA